MGQIAGTGTEARAPLSFFGPYAVPRTPRTARFISLSEFAVVVSVDVPPVPPPRQIRHRGVVTFSPASSRPICEETKRKDALGPEAFRAHETAARCEVRGGRIC